MTVNRRVVVERYSTAARIYCNTDGRLAEYPTISIHPFLRAKLIEYEYDYRRKMPVVKYCFFKYSKTTGLLNIPVALLKDLEIYFKYNLVEYEIVDIPPNKAASIKAEGSGKFTIREDQESAVAFLTSNQPMKALELQTGCLTGDTFVHLRRGSIEITTKLSYLHHQYHQCKEDPAWVRSIPTSVKSYVDGRIQFHSIEDVVYSGIKSVYELVLENEYRVCCTADHLILTDEGWIPASDTLGKLVLCEILDGIELVEVVLFEYVGEEPTYDIVCAEPHHNFVANGIVVHNSGKTFVAINTILALKKRALVVLPASLVNQWTDAFSELSNAKLSVIRGCKSIYDIISSEYSVDADIHLASVNTLQEYAIDNPQYIGCPSFREFIKKMQFGVKVTDECHINFHANTMIDIESDIEHNIYLSATYIRSGKNSEQIFRRIFPNNIRYDKGEYKKYVNITECHYSFGYIEERHVSSQRGYMHSKYENFLLRSPKKINTLFSEIFIPLIDDYFVTIRKPNQKLLIIVGTIDFGRALSTFVSESYPDLMVSEYFGDTDDSVLTEADVIVSTVGSCGTGKDIKGLRTVIMFVSFAAEALAYQTLGRLRVMEDIPEFIYLVNGGIKQHIRHSAVKQPIYKSVGKSFSVIEL